MKAHGKLTLNPQRQGNPCRPPICGGFIQFVLLAHDDLKPAFPIADDPEHLLVLRGRQIRQEQVNGFARAFGLAANAVDAP